MLYIITLAVYGYLFWRMSYLPYQSYIETICAFDELEAEQMDYFNTYKENNTEIDFHYDLLMTKIRDPRMFFVRQMIIPFCHCVLFSIFSLWLFFGLEVITLVGVRIIGSSIFATCLLVLPIHLVFIDYYKKQAKKITEKNFRKKEAQEQADLRDLLERTSADYDATETD